MDVIHERAVGIDISKRDAKVCLRVPGKRAGTFESTVTTWGATTSQILALRDYLIGQNVSTIVMEATSDYWKPFYFLFEDALPVMLVNAKAARNIPGRKTDLLTELPVRDPGAGMRFPVKVARFPVRDQRRGYAAGVVRAGGAAARFA